MKIFILRFLITCLIIFSRSGTYAQTPALEWHKCYGSNYSEYPGSIQVTSDGGYIIAGYSTGADNGDVMGHHGNATVGDIWIVKIDKSGNIEWEKSYGGTDSEAGASIIQTSDGGYIVAGSAASTGCNMTGNHGGFDYWLLKLSSAGDVQWQKMYGGSDEDYASSIALSPDGGYLVAGHTLSNNGDVTGNHGMMDYWIIKVDATGKLEWQKCLGGSDFDDAKSVQATADGGCIVAGTALSSNGNVTGYHGAGDYWIVKLDKQGNMQWQKALGGSMTENAFCIQLTKDGGYIVSGYANSADGDVSGLHGFSYDAWVVKVNATGNILWQKCYGGSSNETANYIQNTNDGGYVFTGLSASSDGDVNCNAGVYDAYVMKIDNAGQLQWQKTMGGMANDEGVCVQPLNDGSFIVLGYTESPDIYGYHTPASSGEISDYLVLKLSAPLASDLAPLVKIDPASAVICSGGRGTITASVLYGGLNPSFQWKKNSVAVGINSPQYPDINFANNDLVSCTVTKGNSCENNSMQGNDAVTIKINNSSQVPGIKIAADNTFLCNCSTITVTADVTKGGASPNYQWMVNGITSGSNTNVFISNKLNAGDVIKCSYADNNVCAANAVISNSITIGGGNGKALAVSISASSDTICKGTNVTYNAQAVNAGTNPVYQWKVNNVNAGTNSSVFNSSTLSNGDIVNCTINPDPFFACASAANASSNNIVMHILASATPTVGITTSAYAICAGSPVSFTATAVNAGANPSYQWKLNGANTGINSASYTSSSLMNNDVINCSIAVDPSFTCVLSNQAVSKNIVMSVTSGAIPSVNISTDKNDVCAGDNITFTATATDAGTNPGFQWILNNSLLPDQSPVYMSKMLVDGDKLFCKMIPGTGACSSAPDSSNTILAIIRDTPVVYISPSDTTIGTGIQLQLVPTISGNISSFQWSPAGQLMNPLSLSTLTSVLNESTTYTLMVANDKGCMGTAMSIIKIFTQLYMPNAFTPNNDDINDVFRIPPATAFTLKEFSIYDKWGNRVFTTRNINEGWGGTVHGKKQNTGVYVYYIRSLINNKEAFFKGSFTLLR